MALEERGSDRQHQYHDLVGGPGTENISPYSAATAYSDPPAYYSEYDWQHPGDSQRIYYHATYQERPELNAANIQLYHHHTYPGMGHHPDFYSPPAGIWPGPSDDALGSQVAGQRYLAGMDLSSGSVNVSPTSSINGKPKRKRVQTVSQRKAANVRERRRMFHLNEAFDELRKRLPAFNYEKRLSRIETLRLAMTYIAFMKEVSIGQDPKSVKLKPHGADIDRKPSSVSSGSPQTPLQDIAHSTNDDLVVKDELDNEDDDDINDDHENSHLDSEDSNSALSTKESSEN